MSGKILTVGIAGLGRLGKRHAQQLARNTPGAPPPTITMRGHLCINDTREKIALRTQTNDITLLQVTHF